MQRLFDVLIVRDSAGRETVACPVCRDGILFLEEFREKGIASCWNCSPPSFFDFPSQNGDKMRALLIDYELDEEEELGNED